VGPPGGGGGGGRRERERDREEGDRETEGGREGERMTGSLGSVFDLEGDACRGSGLGVKG